MTGYRSLRADGARYEAGSSTMTRPVNPLTRPFTVNVNCRSPGCPAGSGGTVAGGDGNRSLGTDVPAAVPAEAPWVLVFAVGAPWKAPARSVQSEKKPKVSLAAAPTVSSTRRFTTTSAPTRPSTVTV